MIISEEELRTIMIELHLVSSFNHSVNEKLHAGI